MIIINRIKKICRRLSIRRYIKNYIEQRLPKDYILIENFTSHSQLNGEYKIIQLLKNELEIVFDIGANIGEWSLYVQKSCPNIKKIYAFEPTPTSFLRLKETSETTVIHPFNIGFSSKKHESNIFIFESNSELNTIHNRDGLSESIRILKSHVKVPIDLETVDEFCVENNVQNIDFIKIDTEGHEVDVLIGMSEMLKRELVKVVQFEYGGTYIDSRRLLKDAYAVFENKPYSIYLLHPDHLQCVNKYDQSLENFYYKNFLAISNAFINSNQKIKRFIL
jgi:FkbM family methyltransferase